MQRKAAERNKERQPEQFKPDFKVGDFLLLYARESKEGRLEEKTEEGKYIPIPNKLRNKLTGPYQMTRWIGERYCAIRIDDKEVIHNVNRLVKHHVWDDIHMRTDTPARTETPDTPPKVGDLIVFPTAYNEQHKCVFGIGKIIEVANENDITFQWLGNKPLSEASKAFALGWVDPRDNKGYYSPKPIHASHPPWTNKDTATNLTASSIIMRGDILNTSGKVGSAARSKIEAMIGEKIPWGA